MSFRMPFASRASLASLGVILAFSLATTGCSDGSSESSAPAAAPAPPAAAAPATPAPMAPSALTTEEATAILAKADALDGTTDQVVSKCAGCMLAMDGKPEHALTAHGYTLHFCADTCKANAEPKLDRVIAALK